jgi:hypothetical protein
MPRKKPKGFAGEKSKHNQEMQKLDQSDHSEDDKPPLWIKFFVDVMMISKLIKEITLLNFRKRNGK